MMSYDFSGNPDGYGFLLDPKQKSNPLIIETESLDIRNRSSY